MKTRGYLGCCAIAFLLFSTGAPAETNYIKTIVKITLRTGPGMDHKIISMIQSGQPVEVLETEGAWSRIQTAEGQIGWIMTSLISTEKPIQYSPAPALANGALTEQQASLHEKIDTLDGENRRLELELADSQRTLDALNASFQAFKDESGEFLELKSSLGKASLGLKKEREKAAHLEDQISQFEMQQNILFALTGAGVLLVGIAVGRYTKRQRRRSLLM